MNCDKETVQESFERLKKTPINNVMIIVACILGMVVTLEIVKGAQSLLYPHSELRQHAEQNAEMMRQLDENIKNAQ